VWPSVFTQYSLTVGDAEADVEITESLNWNFVEKAAMSHTDEMYLALVNDEGQYSIWAESVPVPAGWTAQDVPMTRDGCLEFIERAWSDMRPKSLRTSMSSNRGRALSS
jgi:MbtH protein